MKSHHKKLLVRLLLLVGMLAVTIGPSLAYYGNLRIVGLSSEPEIVEENVSPVFSVRFRTYMEGLRDMIYRSLWDEKMFCQI